MSGDKLIDLLDEIGFSRPWLEKELPELLAWPDDEFLDYVERTVKSGGKTMTLRGRRAIEAALAVERAPNLPMTEWARDKIARLALRVGPVRNRLGREPSIRRMAIEIEVDRDTLTGWIDSGLTAHIAWHPSRKKSAN